MPTVWDGRVGAAASNWVRIRLPEGPETDARMNAINRSVNGDIAVGSRGRDLDQRPAVWSRPPGGEWEAVDAEQFGGEAPAWLVDVTSDAEGRLAVAIGSAENSLGEQIPSVWRRQDAAGSWQPITQTPFKSDGSDGLFGVAVGDETLAISGFSSDGAAAWYSDDGTTWEAAEAELSDDAADSYMAGVVWFDGRFVAVGGIATGLVYEPAAWSSADGVQWRLEGHDFGLNDDGRSTNVGFGASLLSVAGDRLLASASEDFMQHVWSSVDGVTWTPVDNIWDIREEGLGIDGLAGTSTEVLVAADEPALHFHADTWRALQAYGDLMPDPGLQAVCE